MEAEEERSLFQEDPLLEAKVAESLPQGPAFAALQNKVAALAPPESIVGASAEASKELQGAQLLEAAIGDDTDDAPPEGAGDLLTIQNKCSEMESMVAELQSQNARLLVAGWENQALKQDGEMEGMVAQLQQTHATQMEEYLALKQKDGEMESMVAQLRKTNAALVDENQALKQELKTVLAQSLTQQKTPPLAASNEELVALNEQLARDNSRLWEQFVAYHAKVRCDMAELTGELDSYKSALLQENMKLKAMLQVASRPQSRAQ